MRIKILFLISLFSSILTAQDLEQLKALPDDTQKVNRLYEKAMKLRSSGLNEANRYAKACYQAAVQSNNTYSLAKAVNLVSVLKYQSGEYSEAARLMKRALQLRIQVKDTLGQAISLVNLGNMYSEMKRSDLAFNCYENALKFAQLAGNDRWKKGALLSIASLQLKMKRYEQARGNFLTLLLMEENKRDAELNGTCYTNLGVCLLNLGDTLGAESYQQQALDVMDLSGDEIGKADVYTNLAEIYLAKKDIRSAFDALERALVISQKNNYNEGLVNAWRSLSACHALANDYRLAYLYLTKSDSAASKNNALLNEGLTADGLEMDDVSTAEQEASFFSAENTWRLLLIVALALLLVVLFRQFRHEQKEQKA